MKKAEHRRIDAFELWCWRRLLRVPWTARRSNQSILKEISPGISLEGMMQIGRASCRERVSDFIFWGPKSLQMVTAAMKLKDAYSLEGKL